MRNEERLGAFIPHSEFRNPQWLGRVAHGFSRGFTIHVTKNREPTSKEVGHPLEKACVAEH